VTGVDAEMMLRGQMLVKFLQMDAVQMDDAAAALAAQQEAVAALLGVGAVLIQRTLLGGDLVDMAALF